MKKTIRLLVLLLCVCSITVLWVSCGEKKIENETASRVEETRSITEATPESDAPTTKEKITTEEPSTTDEKSTEAETTTGQPEEVTTDDANEESHWSKNF